MARGWHLENLLSGNHITSRYFLIDSAKSVEVPMDLSEDCYCNLSVPIPNEQTLVTRYVLSYYKVFLIWIFNSSFGHMCNYTPAVVAMLQAHLIFLYYIKLYWFIGMVVVFHNWISNTTHCNGNSVAMAKIWHLNTSWECVPQSFLPQGTTIPNMNLIWL